MSEITQDSSPLLEDYMKHLEKCREIPSDLATAYAAAYRAVFKGELFLAHDMYWQLLHEPDRSYYYPPCGDWEKADWIKIFSELPEGTRFEFVPGSLVALWAGLFPGMLDVSTDEGTWDYVYDIDELKNLDNTRNLNRRFRRNYTASTLSLNEAGINEVISFSRKAEDEIRSSHDDSFKIMDEDDMALSFLLDHPEHFPSMDGIILKADGIPVSYMIWERAGSDYYIALFNKSLHGYKGSFDACVTEMCNRISSLGGRYINYACDAGIPGLRFAKRIRKPAFMLKKYTVVLKGKESHE